MKKYFSQYGLLGVLLFSITSCAQPQKESALDKNVIELPISEKKGYGHFYANMIGISPYLEIENNPCKKTYTYPVGIPNGWSEIKKGDIILNMAQFIYQSYHSGKITKEWFESMKKSMKNDLDSSKFSKTPLKCKVSYVIGKDSIGEVKMIVDLNNNLDFTDDKIFKPVEYHPHNKNIDRDSLALSSSFNVIYQRLKNNKIVNESPLVFITYMSKYDRFYYNFPQYRIAQLGSKEIMISNGFTDLSFEKSSIALIDKNPKKGSKVESENLVSINEYIVIKDKVYKNLGVDENKDVLILKKINLLKNPLHSTSIGFKSFPFIGNDFMTNLLLSSEKFKGKYVLLDFWATWCKPCIKEIPHLKTLYDKTDHSKFEIVGIIGDSPSNDLKKLIKKHSINWPQILSNDKNKIKETFGIQGYPTTFLINPEGVIVAKNLRGKELEEKILSLINDE